MHANERMTLEDQSTPVSAQRDHRSQNERHVKASMQMNTQFLTIKGRQTQLSLN